MPEMVMFRLDATFPWLALERQEECAVVFVEEEVVEEENVEANEEASDEVVAVEEGELDEDEEDEEEEVMVAAAAVAEFALPLLVFIAHCGLRAFADVNVSIRKPSTIRLFRASLTTDKGALGPISCSISFVFSTIVFWSSICSGIDREGVRIQNSRPGVFAARRITTGVVCNGACSHCTAAAAAAVAAATAAVIAWVGVAGGFAGVGFVVSSAVLKGLVVANVSFFGGDDAAAGAAAGAAAAALVVAGVAAGALTPPGSIPDNCDFRRGGLLGADKYGEPNGFGSAAVAPDVVVTGLDAGDDDISSATVTTT